ncbi:hypothetical protein [Streptomyces zhihengii]|uniref:hypothetical protein n=1 Tax=Streptomyces zhihengii TaxID=1818004 RepID=UPI0034516762
MSMRRILQSRRRAAAVAITAALALTVVGCGGDGDKGDTSSSSATPTKKEDKGTGGSSAEPEPEATTVIATAKGRDGIVLEINSVERDSGGFVTVNGQVKNTGSSTYYQTTPWRGNEQELQGGGQSVGGATLVDKEGKKRYYVLRDTDGRCLCTSGFTQVDAGSALPVFIQFPAPPESTTTVDFQLPTFQNISVEITG